MKYYVLTEEQRDALLKDLELEKFKTPDQFAITDADKEAQRKAVESVYRRMIYHVCRALS